VTNDSNSTTAVAATPSASDSADVAAAPHTVKYHAQQYVFGKAAFAPLRHVVANKADPSENLHAKIPKILADTLPAISQMRGERGRKTVIRMIRDIYATGLHMHAPATSPVNSQVIPALRYVIAELAKLPVKDPKRVTATETLAEACQNCQQVQAREILRLYSDLTAQTATFERQLLYSLVRQKEAALDRLISKFHGKTCDLDHLQVQPWEQRAHLRSVR